MTEVLKDKVAVITGGSRGLGLAIAETYAREGAKVVIASRSQSSVDAAVQILQKNGNQAAGLACDVADITQVEALADFAIERFGQIDIWVNNAGLSAPYGPTAHIPSGEVLKVMNTNMIGTYNGSVVALRKMLPQKSGKLINLLGRGDNGSVKLQNAYSSSKIWVRNFTKALAQEYSESGIDIFGFNPGIVFTDMINHVEAVAGFEEKMQPLRIVAPLLGNDADIPAAKAVWLASTASDGKNGMMSTLLTKGFIIKRLLRGIGQWLSSSFKKLDLHIDRVEPPKELAPIPIKNRETRR